MAGQEVPTAAAWSSKLFRDDTRRGVPAKLFCLGKVISDQKIRRTPWTPKNFAKLATEL
jgi:hypothetical protein